MNNVISIPEGTWSTLSLLKNSINWYKDNNTKGKYTRAIDIETKAYKNYLDTCIRPKN